MPKTKNTDCLLHTAKYSKKYILLPYWTLVLQTNSKKKEKIIKTYAFFGEGHFFNIEFKTEKEYMVLHQILGNTAVAKDRLMLYSVIYSLYKYINGHLFKTTWGQDPGLGFLKDI